MQAAVLIHLHTKAPTRKATKKLSIPLSTHMEGPTSPQIYYPSPFSHKPASPGNGVRNLWPNFPNKFQCLKFSTHTRRVKKKQYCTSRVIFGLDPLLPPPLQCPHSNKRGTNLLLFKFCIHLHTKVGEIQGP